MDDLRAAIRDIPDFPKPGIIYKDITPLLGDASLFRKTVDRMREMITPMNATKLVVIESRGFLFGAPIAERLGLGLVLVRKPGKLPHDTHQVEYALEYGTDKLEIHRDSLSGGDRAVIIDDILATGGTAAATAKLVEEIGAEVTGYGFFGEIEFLKGREKLGPYKVDSLLRF